MTESVEAPERIWIEGDGECPYFYHEDELSDVGSPVTEYVRADKLLAEIEALREEVERLREVLGRILENEASDYKAAEEFGGYVLDDELREEARDVLSRREN